MLYFGFFSTHIPYVIIAITYIAIFGALRFQNLAMEHNPGNYDLECGIHSPKSIEHHNQSSTFIYYRNNDIYYSKVPIVEYTIHRPPSIGNIGMELSRLAGAISNRPPPLAFY